MHDHIIKVIQTLYQHRELIAGAYVQGKGIVPTEATASAVTSLLKAKALTPYIENTYRLDRRLRVYFDRAVNRVKVYGTSTHYASVVAKIQSMTESYETAMVKADLAGQDECLDQIVDLCDEFATGMKEDIEHFRMVVDIRKGFSGGSITEKLAHNRNHIDQANQMVEAVNLLADADLLNDLQGYRELTTVLRRHLYQRVEGTDDVRRRLFEVQSALNALLFDLEAANRLAEVLLRLDDRFNRQTDLDLPDWDDELLPAAAYRGPGLVLSSYLDSFSEPAETLLPLLAGIADERRPQVRAMTSAAGALKDAGEPAPSRPTPSELKTTVACMFDDARSRRAPVSAVSWLQSRTDKHQIYPYPISIWLGTLSNAVANGLAPPDGWHFDFRSEDGNPRWDTPVLTDMLLEPRAL